MSTKISTSNKITNSEYLDQGCQKTWNLTSQTKETETTWNPKKFIHPKQ